MITAIFVIVIMATVAMLVFSLSGKMVKNTTIQYRHEQAILLARSYTELAIMAVMDYNRSTDCIEDINGVVNGIVPDGPTNSGGSTNGKGYRVQTRIYYLGNSLPCSSTRRLTGNSSYGTSSIVTDYNDTSQTGDSVAGIVVDVYVSYKDPDAPDVTNAPWITYFRRTLQKI